MKVPANFLTGTFWYRFSFRVSDYLVLVCVTSWIGKYKGSGEISK